MTTVFASLATMSFTAGPVLCPSDASLSQRLSEGTTSAEVIGVPSWNSTPVRSGMVSVRLPSDQFAPVASMGWGTPFASRAKRVSNMD